MSLPCREFAIWTLSDLAIRESEDDRITFRGNHISGQYVLPVRSQEETAEQFAVRISKFQKSLPRHSDLSERLALAVKAFMLDGEKSFAAADLVREILSKAPAEKKAEYERLGIGYAFRPIDAPIGTTRRNHRTRRKKRGISPAERQAHTIRTQASRFIRQHKNFDVLLQSRLGSFRQQCWRDATWYESAEKFSASRVKAFEKCDEPFGWFNAMPLSAAAYLYHEQGKFALALLHYRKAIHAARRAVMHEDLRAFVIRWLRLGMKLCKHSARMIPMPPYSGPWVPAEKSLGDCPA
jgi:tetratricopeptide (TPR) repeat protein